MPATAAQRCKFYENGIWNGNLRLTRRRSNLMARTDYVFLYETPRSIIGVKQDGFTLHQWVFSAARRTLSREFDWQTAAQTPAVPNNGNDSGEHEEHNICPNCSECIDCDDCRCWECELCGRRRDEDNICCENCHHCESCCQCSHCAHCGSMVDAVCDCCERCSDCCECYVCSRCGEHVREICGECERCNDCGCNCDSADAPRCRQDFKIEKPANLTGYKINRLRRPIAIELELSSVGDSSELLRWAKSSGAGLVEDGSIPDEGCEINTNPAAGDYLISAMEALARALSSSDADVDHSCGLHVHVDASDYTQYDLRRLIMLWAATERAMFDIAGARRISNTYCHPASEQYIQALTCGFDSKIFRKTLARSLYSRSDSAIPECKTDRYNRARYYALNIHSFFYRKTIEFRLHEAKTSVSVLRNWPRVCGQIVEFALKHSERELKALVCSDKTSSAILALILPKDLQEWVSSVLTARYEARQRAGTENLIEAELDALDTPRRALRDAVSLATQLEFTHTQNQTEVA